MCKLISRWPTHTTHTDCVSKCIKIYTVNQYIETLGMTKLKSILLFERVIPWIMGFLFYFHNVSYKYHMMREIPYMR